MLSQISIVILMNLRSIPQRIWMAVATVFSIAIVIAMLLAFLAMANGFKQTLEAGGSDDIVVVSRSGSQSELNSVLLGDQINLLKNAPGILFDQVKQAPVTSAELYVIVDGIKRTTQSKVNLPLRGLSRNGILLRQGINITEGRIFEAGKNEIIVGRSILEQFNGFDLNQEITLGKSKWTVVGIFSSKATAYEGELWTDDRDIQNQFQRGNSYQTFRAKLQSVDSIKALKEFAANDPRLNVDIVTEADYFAAQADALKSIVFIGWFLGIAMAIGALSGALNTMYNSVAARSKEIATLRAIGFSNFSSFVGTIIEALVLAIIGGIIGCIAAYLLFDGITTSTLGSSFTQVVFKFELSPQSIQDALILAATIGLVGGFFPAIKAATLPVVEALRK